MTTISVRNYVIMFMMKKAVIDEASDELFDDQRRFLVHVFCLLTAVLS